MLKGKKEFVTALFVIVIVLLTLALPYALIEAYGLKVKNLILLMQLVFLAAFSAGMLIWWVVRYSRKVTTQKRFGRKSNGRFVVATNVNMIPLKEGVVVDTKKAKIMDFVPTVGEN